MSIFIVRHAVAVAKHDWSRSDQHRPLTESGEHEAAAIARWFDDAPSVIVCSPTLRCVATVLPLAERFELDIVTRTELLPRAPTAAAELVRSLIARSIDSAVVCTHGELVPSLLYSLPIVDASHTPEHCAKGSIWAIDSLPAGLRATYHQTPERQTRRPRSTTTTELANALPVR